METVNLFNIPQIELEDNTEKILKKVSSPKKISSKSIEKKVSTKKLSIKDKIDVIEREVHRILGVYEKNTVTIRDLDEFHSYINSSISNGIIAIDTETNNSLQPVDCKIMGLCIYTPGQKNAYIPVNHIDITTGEKLPNQITEEEIKTELARLNSTKIIMHNAKFDYQVIKCTCGIALNVYWDTILGARVLNENERAGLKEQYITKIDNSIEKYSIEHLFEGEKYEIFSPELFALYAATDAYMTYKLYQYQVNEFNKPENSKLFDLFMNIEMPVMIPTAEMELNGVDIDIEYTERLSKKFHTMLNELESEISVELVEVEKTISKWRETPEATAIKDGEKKSLSDKVDTPINLGSPTQVAILLYDIFKVKSVNKKSPRSTSKEDLEKILKDNPNIKILTLISKKKHIEKQLSTYIDKLPNCRCSDGKVHASFNQYGADTGRFSSNDPNLQNIPSRGDEKSIRVMFKASPGCIMLGSDFSAQEPRIFATYSQDEEMLNAYKAGKDLYAVIASKVNHNNYEDNLEFYSDGTPNKAGKARRSEAKKILLGLMYGRGPASIAEQIEKSKEEAQEIIDGFYREFPKAKQWIDSTESGCRVNGYVEDLWGRRRRLPDIQLPKYEVKSSISKTSFNPLLHTSGIIVSENTQLIEKYKNLLSTSKYKNEVDKIKRDATKDNVEIHDNGAFISKAERQCVNARVQGGAASMSKRAMIALWNDKEIKRLGFKLKIMVHDELIGECPIENIEEVSRRLAHCMEEAGKPEVSLPMKCDVVTFSNWYIDECEDSIHEKYEKMIEDGTSKEEALKYFIEHYSEFTEEQIREFCGK